MNGLSFSLSQILISRMATVDPIFVIRVKYYILRIKLVPAKFLILNLYGVPVINPLGTLTCTHWVKS